METNINHADEKSITFKDLKVGSILFRVMTWSPCRILECVVTNVTRYSITAPIFLEVKNDQLGSTFYCKILIEDNEKDNMEHENWAIYFDDAVKIRAKNTSYCNKKFRRFKI